MTPLPDLYTSDEVADWLRRDHAWLLERARLDPTHFPSLKVGRFVRFTEAHAMAIVEHLERKPDPDVLAAEDQEKNGWGRPAAAILREQRRSLYSRQPGNRMGPNGWVSRAPRS